MSKHLKIASEAEPNWYSPHLNFPQKRSISKKNNKKKRISSISGLQKPVWISTEEARTRFPEK